MCRWSLLALLAGCTDYVIRNDPDETDIPDPDEATDPEVWGDTCPSDDRVYERFAASTLSAGCLEPEPRPDLALFPAAHCAVDCDEDRTVFWVQVGNKGRTPATGVRLFAYTLEDGERTLLEVRELSGEYLDGWYAPSEVFDLRDLGMDDLNGVIFRVEADQEDCNPINDELNVVGPFCQL